MLDITTCGCILQHTATQHNMRWHVVRYDRMLYLLHITFIFGACLIKFCHKTVEIHSLSLTQR